MPVPYKKGRLIKWQCTFSHGDKEKKVIEKYMEEEDETYNGAIRRIIIEYGKIKGWI